MEISDSHHSLWSPSIHQHYLSPALFFSLICTRLDSTHITTGEPSVIFYFLFSSGIERFRHDILEKDPWWETVTRILCLSLLSLSFPHTSCLVLSCLVCLSLTNHQLIFLGEIVGWDFQVKRSGSFSYTARDIVVRTVAGTEPTTEITSFTNGDTSQMCAYTQHDEPLGFLYSVAIALGVTEGFDSIDGG